MAPQGCTPLADLNGRSRAGLVTPSKSNLAKDNEESWTICASKAKVMREKLSELPEQRRRADAAEEKVASLEKLIAELQNALASKRADGASKERKRQPQQEEKTVELANARVELHQAQKLLEHKDSTIDRLIPQVVAGSVQEKQQVRNKEAEIECLRRELNNSRAEVAQCKSGYRDTQQRLEMAEAELDRVLPGIVADRMQGRKSLSHKDAELVELRLELESARSELVEQTLELQQAHTNQQTFQLARSKHLELQQAVQELACKNGDMTCEMDQLRQELENARSGSVRQDRCLNLELRQSLQDLEFKTAENERLRRELAASRAECSQPLIELERLRTDLEFQTAEIERLRRELAASRAEGSQHLTKLDRLRTESKFPGDYLRAEPLLESGAEQRRLLERAVEDEVQKLHQRSVELQMRELASAKSEPYLFRNHIEPVVLPLRSTPVTPQYPRFPAVSKARTPPLTPRQPFYCASGSSFPGREGASMWDRLNF